MPLEIKDIPFFHSLDPRQLEVVKNFLIEKSFEKGEVIHNEGARCARLFFVRSGRVKIYKTSPSGKEQIFEILNAGDTCACNPGNVTWYCQSTAEALAPTKVWFFSRENYIRMVQNDSHLMQALNDLFAKRLQCFSDIIEDMSLKDSKKRLIKFLLNMLPKEKGDKSQDTLYIKFTREEIAQRLGTARETIARQISDLKRRKLIDVKPYQIIIKNKKALEELLN